jgi:hypothetical protein
LVTISLAGRLLRRALHSVTYRSIAGIEAVRPAAPPCSSWASPPRDTRALGLPGLCLGNSTKSTHASSRPESDVEIKLVHRAQRPNPSVPYRRIPLYGHARGV